MRQLVEQTLAATAGKPGMALFFNGSVPRYLGHVGGYESADAALLAHRLSATYLSRAHLQGDDRVFLVAHG